MCLFLRKVKGQFVHELAEIFRANLTSMLNILGACSHASSIAFGPPFAPRELPILFAQ